MRDAATSHGPGIGCTCEWDEEGNPVGGKHKPLCRMAESSPAATTHKVTRRGRELLAKAALGKCAYDGDGLPPCPEEWPDNPEGWCGSCIAREVQRG